MISMPNIPLVHTGQFPQSFENYLAGWGCFDRATIQANIGRLLMLDFDFGNTCSLCCGHCFRRTEGYKESDEGSMSWDEVQDVIRQGKALGLREVKILGAGEPFQNKSFLPFLRFLTSEGITTSVFTRGHVFGSNRLARLYNSHLGINTGMELAEAVYELSVSLIVSLNTFDAGAQDEMVRVPGYTAKRTKALEMLAAVGFNRHNPTRLGLGMSPTMRSNIAEMLDNYIWARERNIYPIVTPTMVSGLDTDGAWRKITPELDELVELYTEIYHWNISRGIQTLDQVREEGISAYAGVRPCNQVACGLYATLDGRVVPCPGDDRTTLGDLKTQSLREIWEASENCRRAGTYNCGCVAKAATSIPPELFRRVMHNLEGEE